MIEPAARCRQCHRDVSSAELTEWAKKRDPEAARAWWGWNVNGWCAGCYELEYQIALEEDGGEESES